MARSQPAAPPPCYAMVLPGLEEIAGDELAHDLGCELKKTTRGVVIFRLDEITPAVLRARTTEDVFLLAWGTDDLTYRAEDLDRIQRWTARQADWDRLLKLHHAVRPKPKGRPTYRLVVQMHGKHGYLRRDARKALAKGLAGKFPASWRPAEENASVEVWLTIDNKTAVCGLRLSDRTMRHRDYKGEHRPASLRPSVAAAMVRLAKIKPADVVLDPMCGAGTILAEYLLAHRRYRGMRPRCLGGDLEFGAVRAADVNLRPLGEPPLARWDATRLPLAPESVARVLTNPPFGKQLSDEASIGPLYRDVLAECDRVLQPGGAAVLLVSDLDPLRAAAERVGWRREQAVRLRLLGQPAFITVWRKPNP